jgi:dTDP-4-amino-4,6-dideoxygalactose transaminase
VLRSGRLSLGPTIDRFEELLAERVGAPYVAAVSSGTAGLHLLARIAELGPGDEAITSPISFAASANCFIFEGATPVFADVDPRTLNLDPGALEASITPRTKAVVAVDMFGYPCELDEIRAICERRGLTLIEDAAEALGASYRGRAAGSFGLAGVLSFNGNKIITTSGGGMLVTDDGRVATQARHLATQAREPVPHYEHRTVGYNYRLSNLLAALGRGQLYRLADLIAARRVNREHYLAALGDLPGLTFMPVAGYGTPNWWLTCVLIDPAEFGAGRDRVLAELARHDIEARPTWKPMHLQPVFQDCVMRGGAVSADLFHRGLCLPSGSALTDADRDRVVAAVRAVAGR